jgi:hypothetical protein
MERKIMDAETGVVDGGFVRHRATVFDRVLGPMRVEIARSRTITDLGGGHLYVWREPTGWVEIVRYCGAEVGPATTNFFDFVNLAEQMRVDACEVLGLDPYREIREPEFEG